MKKIIFIHLYNDISGSPKVLSEVIKIIKKKKFHINFLHLTIMVFYQNSKIQNLFFLIGPIIKYLIFFIILSRS